MKFALAQLRNIKMPYSFYEEIDFSTELDGFEDIISSKPCKVTTLMKESGKQTWVCEFDFEIELMLQDSVTLDEVPFTIKAQAKETFSTDKELEDCFLIETQTLDTREAILASILIEKPMSFTNSEYVDDEEDAEESDEEYINPAFAGLKDLFK